jgi:hypothetical protein
MKTMQQIVKQVHASKPKMPMPLVFKEAGKIYQKQKKK